MADGETRMAERKRRSNLAENATVECACGGLIYEIDLPVSVRDASGMAKLWLHDHGDIYCYPDDRSCMAEPYDLPRP